MKFDDKWLTAQVSKGKRIQEKALKKAEMREYLEKAISSVYNLMEKAVRQCECTIFYD